MVRNSVKKNIFQAITKKHANIVREFVGRMPFPLYKLKIARKEFSKRTVWHEKLFVWFKLVIFVERFVNKDCNETRTTTENKVLAYTFSFFFSFSFFEKTCCFAAEQLTQFIF